MAHVTLAGTVTRAEVESFDAAFGAALEAHDRLGLVVDMSGFGDFERGALWRDLRLETKFLPLMRKTPRVAVVCDKSWVEMAVRFLDPMLPSVQARVFDTGAMAAALEFASTLPEPAPEPEPHGPGLTLLEEEGILAFEIDGYLEEADIEAAFRRFAETIEAESPICIFARINAFRGFNPKILFDPALWGLKWHAARSFSRYAVVTDEAWIKPVLAFANAVTPGDIRLYATAEAEEAMAWVKGGLSP